MKNYAVIFTFVFAMIRCSVFACSCIGERTVKQEIKYSDAVIIGKIISKSYVILNDSVVLKTPANDSLKEFAFLCTVAKYELAVSIVYKGHIKSDTIAVYTGKGGGDCGVLFEIGQEYIVYGMKETYFGQINNEWFFPKGQNILWTNICSRTKLNCKEEIQEIEKYRKGKLRTGNTLPGMGHRGVSGFGFCKSIFVGLEVKFSSESC